MEVNMQLSDKFSVLGEVGILDWLNKGTDDVNVRTLVNSIAEYYIEPKSIYGFAPACEWE